MSEEQSQTVAVTGSRWQTMLDGIALSLAGMCGVHCLMMPLLLIAFPIIGSSFFVDDAFHMWMLLAVLPTTGLAIFLGCRKHKDLPVFLLSVGGFALLCIAFLSHGHAHGYNHAAHAGHGWISRESLITTLGGIVMVTAHIRNFRLCRKAAKSGRKADSCQCHG